MNIYIYFFFYHFQKKKYRVARSDHSLLITAVPNRSVYIKQDITLSVTSSDGLNDSSKQYKWECSKYF